jgi:hypothetical protein
MKKTLWFIVAQQQWQSLSFATWHGCTWDPHLDLCVHKATANGPSLLTMLNFNVQQKVYTRSSIFDTAGHTSWYVALHTRYWFPAIIEYTFKPSSSSHA